MKRLLAFVVSGCLALGLAGCSNENFTPSIPLETTEGTPSINTTAERTADTPIPIDPIVTMHAVALPNSTETTLAGDGTVLCSISRQNIQLMLDSPIVAEQIMADLEARTAPFLANASHIKNQARADYQSSEYWSEYFIDISYTPLRLDQAVLSLFGNFSSYAGGPHPSLVSDSVTYDLQSGQQVYLDDILDPGCSGDTLFQLIKAQLSHREEDLYYDYEDALRDRFTGELHSIRSWYFSRNGLCFHFAPYDIAPYSSGTIIAELPYSELSGVLLEKYIPVEVSDATGSMYAEAFIDDDIERFSTIADVLLDKDGMDILLYPDAVVTDVRIETGTRYSDTDQYLAGATIFAADTMQVGDAIRLTTDMQDEKSVLRLIYRSAGQEYSAFITYDAAGDSILLSHG